MEIEIKRDVKLDAEMVFVSSNETRLSRKYGALKGNYVILIFAVSLRFCVNLLGLVN